MNVQDLFNRAAQIRDEKEIGANTAGRVGGLMFDMLSYSVDNRRALNGDKDFGDANAYPYLAIYIETSDDWTELNRQLDDINSIATTKLNGNIRYYLSGVRVDIQNRTLSYANQYTSQVAVGPLQVIGGKLAQATTPDKTFRRIYNGSWTAWEEVACVGKAGVANGAEVFNYYTGDGANKATGNYAHAEGYKTTASGISSHAEGDQSKAHGPMSHAEGVNNTVSGRGAHAEGSDNVIKADSADGRSSIAAHAEGWNNQVDKYGNQAHVEGSSNYVNASNAHAEGYSNRINNGARNSHIEGESNTINNGSHVSHTEGGNNTNNGAMFAHIEGKGNVANSGAVGAHVGGLNNTVNNEGESACGYWNKSSTGKTLYSIGVGSSELRKNAFEIERGGNAYVYGVNGYDGQNATGAVSVQNLVNKIDNKINALENKIAYADATPNIIDIKPFFDAMNEGRDLTREEGNLPDVPLPQNFQTKVYYGKLDEGVDSRIIIAPLSIAFNHDAGGDYLTIEMVSECRYYQFYFKCSGLYVVAFRHAQSWRKKITLADE